MGLITQILRPEWFAADRVAQAIYEASPDLDPSTGKYIEWNSLEAAPTLRVAAEQMLQTMVRLGIIARDRRSILQPDQMDAEHWAMVFFLVTTPEVALYDMQHLALAWQVQEQAIREGYVYLMQLALERLVSLGVLA